MNLSLLLCIVNMWITILMLHSCAPIKSPWSKEAT